MTIAQTTPADRPWRTAVLAGMASYLDSAALVSSGTAISVLYAPSFGLTPGSIGLILACQQMSFAVGALFGGRFGDRFGRRRVLTVALIGFVVGALVLAAATQPWMLVVGAVLAGLSIGADLPVALAMANEAAPQHKKGRMVVLSQLLWTLGIASVQLVVSFVGHLGVTGGRILFGGLAVVAAIVLVLRFTLPESAEWEATRQAADSNAAGSTIRFQSIGQLVRKPVVYAVVALALYYTTWNVGASINGKYSSYIWTKLSGGDVETFARLNLLALPLTFGATLLFMAVVDTKARRVFTIIGTALILVGWAPLAFSGASQGAMLAVVFLFGVGSCFAGEPLFKVLGQERIPTLLRTTAQGVTIAVARVVAAVLALVVPTLLVSHATSVFVGIFLCAVVAAVILLVWIPRLPRATELEEPALMVAETNAAPARQS